MLDFAYDVGFAIKNAGAKQMVTTGFIDVKHAIGGGVTDSILGQFYVSPYKSWTTSPFDVLDPRLQRRAAARQRGRELVSDLPREDSRLGGEALHEREHQRGLRSRSPASSNYRPRRDRSTRAR